MAHLRTAGIDLSAQMSATGVAIVNWVDHDATVEEVSVGKHSDADLIKVMTEADKTGIDSPLGWPVEFLRYVAAHMSGGSGLVVPDTREPLRYRRTDREVRKDTGLQGLSVSSDRIASGAMRCAALMFELAQQGRAIDRTGRTGVLVEVYPAAALRRWSFSTKDYKGKKQHNNAARSELVDALLKQATWLHLNEFETICRQSDDALDAVVCAVIAAFAKHGATDDVPDEFREEAWQEGWIAQPTVHLADWPGHPLTRTLSGTAAQQFETPDSHR